MVVIGGITFSYFFFPLFHKVSSISKNYSHNEKSFSYMMRYKEEDLKKISN